MFLRSLRPVRRPIRDQPKHAFSKLFVNGKSFIKLSTDFPTLGSIMKAELLKETPFISNNFDNYPNEWHFSSKVLGTRIRMNLSDRRLKLDPALFKEHPALKQIAVNASMATATGQSRIIIVAVDETSGFPLLTRHRYHRSQRPLSHLQVKCRRR